MKTTWLISLFLLSSSLCHAFDAEDYKSCVIRSFQSTDSKYKPLNACDGRDIQKRVVDAYTKCREKVISDLGSISDVSQLKIMNQAIEKANNDADLRMSIIASDACPSAPFRITKKGMDIKSGTGVARPTGPAGASQ